MAAESLKDKKVRAGKIVRLLKQAYPDSKCSLEFKSAHQLMVATILSAQCTDERVNMTTPQLFRKYRSVKAFAGADLKELEKDIYSTGFYVNKAKAIKNSARALVENHGGKIPRTLDELVKLLFVVRVMVRARGRTGAQARAPIFLHVDGRQRTTVVILVVEGFFPFLDSVELTFRQFPNPRSQF